MWRKRVHREGKLKGGEGNERKVAKKKKCKDGKKERMDNNYLLS